MRSLCLLTGLIQFLRNLPTSLLLVFGSQPMKERSGSIHTKSGLCLSISLPQPSDKLLPSPCCC